MGAYTPSFTRFPQRRTGQSESTHELHPRVTYPETVFGVSLPTLSRAFPDRRNPDHSMRSRDTRMSESQASLESLNETAETLVFRNLLATSRPQAGDRPDGHE